MDQRGAEVYHRRLDLRMAADRDRVVVDMVTVGNRPVLVVVVLLLKLPPVLRRLELVLLLYLRGFLVCPANFLLNEKKTK